MNENGINEIKENTVSSEKEHRGEGHHHHHHHHSSSHHSKSKRKGRKKKKIEISKNTLVLWVTILTIIVTLLTVWNFETTIRLEIALERLQTLIDNPSASVQEGSQTATDDSIPDYVKEEAGRVAEQVKKLQSEDTVSFIAISDMHLDSNDSPAVNALSHAGMAMKVIREKVDIDFAVNLGDITTGSSKTTVDEATKEITTAREITKDGFDGIPNFFLVGNHDLLLYSYDKNKDYLNSQELYELIGKYNTGSIADEGEEDRGYCYRDFEDSKLRVIALNTNDIKNVTDESILTTESKYCTMSPEQISWLEKTLKMTDKKDAKEWKILLLSHIPLYDSGYSYVAQLLDGYESGTSGTVSVKGSAVPYDFTGANKAKIISNIHGHLHNYRTDNIGKAKLSSIGIPNACYGRNNSKATSGSEEYRNKYGEKTTYNKTYNTKDDTAFCVVTIDFKYNRIYATCYGAGYDREISY